MTDDEMGVQPERDPYLIDRHPLLRNAVKTVRGTEEAWWVPREDFEVLAKERDELRRALAMLNVAFRIHDPRVSLDVTKILDSVGQTMEQAQATGGIILSVRQRRDVQQS